tara:strand:+ start:1281 stop:1523 length:243 start_codon:yes stop_codon:yes gene_type:complete
MAKRKTVKLIKRMKKRNKTRLNLVRKTCTIKRLKIKRNKFLKNKKKILRITKRLCKLKKKQRKMQNQLGILRFKNNTAYH